MNEEILAGLKLSLEGGHTLDSAVQSFINAGYSPVEINEAAAALAKGPTPQNSIQPLPKTTQVSELPQAQSQETKPAETTSPKMKLLLIIAIVLVLLIISGAIVTLLFKDQILSLFNS